MREIQVLFVWYLSFVKIKIDVDRQHVNNVNMTITLRKRKLYREDFRAPPIKEQNTSFPRLNANRERQARANHAKSFYEWLRIVGYNPTDESLITRSRLSIGVQTSNLQFD